MFHRSSTGCNGTGCQVELFWEIGCSISSYVWAGLTGWWLVDRREDLVSQRTSTVLGLMWRVDELGQASMVLRGHIFPTI